MATASPESSVVWLPWPMASSRSSQALTAANSASRCATGWARRMNHRQWPTEKSAMVGVAPNSQGPPAANCASSAARWARSCTVPSASVGRVALPRMAARSVAKVFSLSALGLPMMAWMPPGCMAHTTAAWNSVASAHCASSTASGACAG